VLQDASQVLAVRLSDRDHGLRANRNAFTFRMDGRRSTNGTFLFCDDAAGHAQAAVIVSVSGRPRVVRDPATLASGNCLESTDQDRRGP
jgi:hypothetical protein